MNRGDLNTLNASVYLINNLQDTDSFIPKWFGIDSGRVGIALEWAGSRKLDFRQPQTRKIKDLGPPQKRLQPGLVFIVFKDVFE